MTSLFYRLKIGRLRRPWVRRRRNCIDMHFLNNVYVIVLTQENQTCYTNKLKWCISPLPNNLVSNFPSLAILSIRNKQKRPHPGSFSVCTSPRTEPHMIRNGSWNWPQVKKWSPQAILLSWSRTIFTSVWINPSWWVSEGKLLEQFSPDLMYSGCYPGFLSKKVSYLALPLYRPLQTDVIHDTVLILLLFGS